MNGSIRLHPKYGVNPTISQCFWCGKDKNEIALLGAAYKGEAPMHMLLDYEPCDTCRENMGKGVALFEATGMTNGKYDFTGRWMVIVEDAVRRLFHPEDVAAQVLHHRKAILDPEAFGKLVSIYKEVSDA